MTIGCINYTIIVIMYDKRSSTEYIYYFWSSATVTVYIRQSQLVYTLLLLYTKHTSGVKQSQHYTVYSVYLHFCYTLNIPLV